MSATWQDPDLGLGRDALAAKQLERLRWSLRHAWLNVPAFRAKCEAASVHPEDLRTLADLARFPFTVKEDFRQAYPFGLLAVPREQVVRIHASSGTTGKPTVVGYTKNDIATWGKLVARSIHAAGGRPGDIVQIAYGYGLFTGGLGIHQGAERLGCTVVPISGGQTARQVLMLRDLGAEMLCCTPSYALHVAHALAEAGVEPGTLKVRYGLFGAEPWTEEMRAAIQRQLSIAALDIYGLSEIVGPGVAAECLESRNGAHIQEDHFLPEVVDPETGQPLPPGQEGELVLTTLTKEALPMLRYRTGDLSVLDDAPCACRRTFVRMRRVRGRRDDMLVIRGVNLYPSEIERILLAAGGIAPHYQIVLERPAAMDEVTVLCEPADPAADRAALARRAAHALREQTGLTMAVDVVPPGAVPRSEGKAVRVLDRRGLIR